MNLRYQMAGWLLVLWMAAPAFADQRPYIAGSQDDIERAHANEAFILVLWEMSCSPCHGEMTMLGKLMRDHPEMNLVLVGTDPLGTQGEVAALLEQYGLEGVESWLFADDNTERLRYTIDPEWYGELPRNYLYDADGGRTGFSGRLDEERTRDWLSLD